MLMDERLFPTGLSVQYLKNLFFGRWFIRALFGHLTWQLEYLIYANGLLSIGIAIGYPEGNDSRLRQFKLQPVKVCSLLGFHPGSELARIHLVEFRQGKSESGTGFYQLFPGRSYASGFP